MPKKARILKPNKAEVNKKVEYSGTESEETMFGTVQVPEGKADEAAENTAENADKE